MVSRKALRLLGQNSAATFTVPRAMAQWNHRRTKVASVGGLFHFHFGFGPLVRPWLRHFPFAFSKARMSTAIKAAINSDETVAAIFFALGLSFHEPFTICARSVCRDRYAYRFRTCSAYLIAVLRSEYEG